MAPAAYDHLRQDDDLEQIVTRHGPLTIEPAEDFFARFVTSILRQQVSMASAAATRERLFSRIEVTPEGILETDETTLRDCGLSRQKARYVTNLATAFLENGYSRAYFADMEDDEVLEELTAITGIGTWTAKMQLMFNLGRDDVFPVEDLGIRKGMETLFGEMNRSEMVERASVWKPYRTYASLYLWRVEEGEDGGVSEVTTIE